MELGNPSKKLKQVVAHGHIIDYPGRTGEKMHYVHTPKEVVQAALAMGMEPRDEIPEEEDKVVSKRPDTADAVQSQVFDAFEMLVGAGERESFTAAGTPHAEAVSNVVGWAVSKAEVGDLWVKFQSRDKD